ncbi:unnamed protein product [Brassica oleracea]|uniref:Uncharacterized protein n=3 Tax=Brassica oleracea TaxID=3712 RepID=A0A0D3C4V2_BRAOL|nr:unnamed protein product [Brassica oleracea]
MDWPWFHKVECSFQILPVANFTFKAIAQMEGLIPFVYRAFMQIRYGDESSISSSYYVRLPGDSGRFERSDFEVTGLGSSSNMASSKNTTTTTAFAVFTGVQSPVHRRVVT